MHGLICYALSSPQINSRKFPFDCDKWEEKNTLYIREKKKVNIVGKKRKKRK